jgi:hypothetical protein
LSGSGNFQSKKGKKLAADHRYTSIEHTLIDVLIAGHSKTFKPGIYMYVFMYLCVYGYMYIYTSTLIDVLIAAHSKTFKPGALSIYIHINLYVYVLFIFN